jgi:hypothetical protein
MEWQQPLAIIYAWSISLNIDQISNQLVKLSHNETISADLILLRWFSCHIANLSTVVEVLQQFVSRTAGPPDIKHQTNGDSLFFRFGGNDHEPCLILQNQFADGSSGGTITVNEEQAKMAIAGLNRFSSTIESGLS